MKQLFRNLAGFPWQHRSQFLDVVATRFIRRLMGPAQACLVSAENGKHYVVKLARGHGESIFAANEFLGYSMQTAMGLPSPRYGRVYLSADLIESTPMLWVDTECGPCRPQANFYFATEFLGLDFQPPQRFFPVQVTEYLSKNEFRRVRNRHDFLGALILDVFTNKMENRKVIFRGRHYLKAYFIDNSAPGCCADTEGDLGAPLYLQREIYQDLWKKDAIDYWLSVLTFAAPRVINMVSPFGKVSDQGPEIRLCNSAVLDRIAQMPKLLTRFAELLGNIDGAT